MAGETFREMPPTVAAPVRVPIPAVRETHSSIDVLSRSATHLQFRSESTHPNPAEADLACRIANNVARLRLEGSIPLAARLTGLLQALD